MDENIQKNIDAVFTLFNVMANFKFGFDSKSLYCTNCFLSLIRLTKDYDREFKKKLIYEFGSYFGQCVIKAYGGEWQRKDGRLGININDDNWVFPYERVKQHLENGDNDSIYSFYKKIP